VNLPDANHQGPEKMLSEDECCSLYEFFCDGVLDRIEAQHGFAIEQTRASRSSSSMAKNAWIYRLNTLGIAAPRGPTDLGALVDTRSSGQGIQFKSIKRDRTLAQAKDRHDRSHEVVEMVLVHAEVCVRRSRPQ
jgi:hypothetical protein